MKKNLSLSIALIAICLSPFAATAIFPIEATLWENPSQNLRVVTVCNLSATDLEEITKGLHPDMAVEFSAHSIFPISMFLKGDLINLIQSPDKIGQIEVNQTFYARCLKEGDMILSIDLTEWKPILEFITGNVGFNFCIDDGQSNIKIKAEINRRN